MFTRAADPALGGTNPPGGRSRSRAAPAAAAAALARRRGDFERACQLDERALTFDPDDPLATLGRAEDARATGDVATARRMFEAAATLDPGWAAPWLGLARVELDRGEPAAAARWSRIAAEQEPDAPAAWLTCAEAERRAGRRGEALAALDRALALAASAADPQTLVRVAAAQQALGGIERARRTLRLARTFRREPNETPEGRALARVLRAAGREAEARWLEQEMSEELR